MEAANWISMERLGGWSDLKAFVFTVPFLSLSLCFPHCLIAQESTTSSINNTVTPAPPESATAVRRVISRWSGVDSTAIPVEPEKVLLAQKKLGLLPTSLSQDLQNLACSKAAAQFIQPYRDYLTSHSASEFEKLSATARAYDKNCLVGLPESFEWISNSPAAHNRVAVLAVFSESGIVPFCGAYVLGPTTIVTVKHCFFIDSGTVNIDAVEKLKSGKMRLIIISDDPQSVLVRSLVKTGPTLDDDTAAIPAIFDYAFLDLQSPVTDLLDEAEVQPGEGTSEVQAAYVPGYFPFTSAAPAATPGDVISRIRWSRKLCAVTGVSATGCVHHSCQSLEDYSGTPIFAQARKTNKIIWVGLQVGANFSADSCVSADFPLGNLGVSAANIRKDITVIQ